MDKCVQSVKVHFVNGCPGAADKEKKHLQLTLLDHMDVTEEELAAAAHQPGAGCTCKLCSKLKRLEDRWIMRLGSFYFGSGLNDRDEIKQIVRTGKSGNRQTGLR